MGKLQKKIETVIRETIKPTSKEAITQKVVVNNKIQEIVVEMTKEFPRILLPKSLKKEDVDRYLNDVQEWVVKWLMPSAETVEKRRDFEA